MWFREGLGFGPGDLQGRGVGVWPRERFSHRQGGQGPWFSHGHHPAARRVMSAEEGGPC